MIHFAPEIAAGMMELVDMRDLGSRGEIRWGSSPHARTRPLCRTGRFFAFPAAPLTGLRRGSDAFLSGTKQKAPVSRRLSLSKKSA